MWASQYLFQVQTKNLSQAALISNHFTFFFSEYSFSWNLWEILLFSFWFHSIVLSLVKRTREKWEDITILNFLRVKCQILHPRGPKILQFLLVNFHICWKQTCTKYLTIVFFQKDVKWWEDQLNSTLWSIIVAAFGGFLQRWLSSVSAKVAPKTEDKTNPGH